jgi:hypothetical protein
MAAVMLESSEKFLMARFSIAVVCWLLYADASVGGVEPPGM